MKKISTVLLIILFVISIALAIDISTEGDVLAKLENTEASLLESNRQLSQSLAQESSLTSLIKEAQALGYVEPADIVYLGHQEFALKTFNTD